MYETKKIKKQKLLEKLENIKINMDTELGHSEADKLLLEYIDDKDIKRKFDEISKWYA